MHTNPPINGARSDLRVLGFHSPMRQQYFDVTAWSALAKSNSGTPESVHMRTELKKEREYKQRIQEVDHGDFPSCFLHFWWHGTQGRLCHQTPRRGSGLQARSTSLFDSMFCRISFTLLRSAMLLLRGSRPPRRTTIDFNIERAVVEMDIGGGDGH